MKKKKTTETRGKGGQVVKNEDLKKPVKTTEQGAEAEKKEGDK